MAKYAEGTTVTSEQSRGEIERTLARYGADAFGYGWDQQRAMISFTANGRQVRFLIEMPARGADEFTTYMRGSVPYERTAEEAEKRWEQACRQRWRALALVVKAKLEAVDAGISEFESEFLAHIVLPNGQTFGDWAGPELERAYATGGMPPSLLALPAGGS